MLLSPCVLMLFFIKLPKYCNSQVFYNTEDIYYTMMNGIQCSIQKGCNCEYKKMGHTVKDVNEALSVDSKRY
jgi:hypothetical protein